jgi:hypothetical protein
MRAGVLCAVLLSLLTAPAGAAIPFTPWGSWRPAPVVLPSPNAADTYAQAAKLYDQILVAHTWPFDPTQPLVDTPSTDPWGVDPEDMPVPERVALYARALALIHQALGIECRFTPSENYLSVCRGMDRGPAFCSLLRMESALRAQQGDPAGAADCALDALRVARDVASQREYFSELLSRGCAQTAAKALTPAIGTLTEREARACLGRLQGIEASWVPLGEVVDGEERLARLNFQYILSDPALVPRRISEFIECSGMEPNPARVANINLWASWREIGEYYDAVRARVAEPFDCHTPVPLPAHFPACLVVDAPWLKSFARHGYAVALVRLAMVQLAVQAYRLGHGALPPDLPALVPGYLPAIPPDPFAAAPLRSATRDGSLVVYSLGPDAKDDGGTPLGERIAPDALGDAAVVIAP